MLKNWQNHRKIPDVSLLDIQIKRRVLADDLILSCQRKTARIWFPPYVQYSKASIEWHVLQKNAKHAQIWSVSLLFVLCPDTFASKVAAIQDQYADASIGNVTGSNAVNVFLGIGVSSAHLKINWVIHSWCKYIGACHTAVVVITIVCVITDVILWLLFVNAA